MSYFVFDNVTDELVAIKESFIEVRPLLDSNPAYSKTRHDIKSFEEAEALAEKVSKFTGELWLPVDRSEYVHPRYDVMEAPKVGEFVSYGFNGDYYPDSKIVRISDSFRIVYTESGNKYYRRKKTASWIRSGGTWSMVKGHHERWNPEF